MELFFMVIVIIGFIIFFIWNRFRYNKELIEYFSKETYIDWKELNVDREFLEFTKHYWNYNKTLTKHCFTIDDLSWNDLDLDLLYTKINATQSSAGAQVLYYKLRTYSLDVEETKYFSTLIDLFQNNQSLKAQTLISLFQLGNQNHTRLFSILFEELKEIMKNIYVNYHFRETITNHDILFDYKLHEGPTTTHNAILLLEHLGYNQTIVTQANHLAQYYRIKNSWEKINLKK